jgi:hypothetical protein
MHTDVAVKGQPRGGPEEILELGEEAVERRVSEGAAMSCCNSLGGERWMDCHTTMAVVKGSRTQTPVHLGQGRRAGPEAVCLCARISQAVLCVESSDLAQDDGQTRLPRDHLSSAAWQHPTPFFH